MRMRSMPSRVRVVRCVFVYKIQQWRRWHDCGGGACLLTKMCESEAATHRAVDAEAAKEWGMGYPMGARIMSGQTKFHEELENKLAEFMQKEDAFLLNYGYQGCQSAIEAKGRPCEDPRDVGCIMQSKSRPVPRHYSSPLLPPPSPRNDGGPLTSLPTVVRKLQGILLPGVSELLQAFYRANGSTFRIFLDDTCVQPANWTNQWASQQSGCNLE